MIKTKPIVLMATLLIMILPAVSFDSEINLPKTGQQTCYDESGNVIDCPGTGQDGDIQAGVEWPSPRFLDNGDGTITDHLTGLIWLKNALCVTNRSWYGALTFCNNLASGSCGLSDGSVAGDWRLPNIIELESLFNTEESKPGAWLRTQGFNNAAGEHACYWSSTSAVSPTYMAWLMCIGYIDDDTTIESSKSNLRYVWPVRGGQ